MEIKLNSDGDAHVKIAAMLLCAAFRRAINARRIGRYVNKCARRHRSEEEREREGGRNGGDSIRL